MFKWNTKNKNIFDEQLLVKSVNRLAYDIMNDISDSLVVPFDTGYLQEKSVSVQKATLDNKNAYIIWDAIYARRLYFNPQFNFKNGRKGRWADEWLYGSKSELAIEKYKETIRSVL